MIKATIIQDSISNLGKRITTFELEYPRFIHSEFMTHRMFSRNAASSRAIPVEKMHEHIMRDPAEPVHWGKNQSGMQAKEELDGPDKSFARYVWGKAKESAIEFSRGLLEVGLHKQIANRVTEPFQTMKTICTATEFANWYWLRDHQDAQPEIHMLAAKMLEAQTNSKPTLLFPGEWHVPYVNRARSEAKLMYIDADGNEISEDDAKMISASCCAQVSYRKSDDSIDKAKGVFERLIYSEPVHASPIEHQATPMFSTKWYPTNDTTSWESGVTHVNKFGLYCSGNFIGWIQYRQLFSNHSK